MSHVCAEADGPSTNVLLHVCVAIAALAVTVGIASPATGAEDMATDDGAATAELDGEDVEQPAADHGDHDGSAQHADEAEHDGHEQPLKLFDAAALLIVLASILGLLNHHFLKLPFAIGMMIASMVASLIVLAIDAVYPSLGFAEVVRDVVSDIDFAYALLHGMISFLLFAGALHVDLEKLQNRVGSILTLASVGLLISTGLVAGVSWWLFGIFGLEIGFLPCLIFGALISPTDPIAVLGLMRSAGAPETIEIKIVGESLFNDGFAVVLFSVLVGVSSAGSMAAHGGVSVGSVASMLAVEVLGGIGLGLIGGFLAYSAMYTMDEANLEILISLGLVLGISAIAFRLHMSAPLGCVVAGLFIGNRGRQFAMSERTRNDLDVVWHFIDEMLNAVLFLLIGLEVVAIPFESTFLIVGLIMIPLTILARFTAVSIPLSVFALRRDFETGARRVLTWGGLKGGISIALAMSLPPELPGRSAILTATYAIVIFSIGVQGLTVGKLIEHVMSDRENAAE